MHEAALPEGHGGLEALPSRGGRDDAGLEGPVVPPAREAGDLRSRGRVDGVAVVS